jgi:hypothetical protein
MSTCYQDFQSAVDQRLDIPLSNGYFKLVEVDGEFGQYLGCLDDIEDSLRGRSQTTLFRCCTRGDKHVWLRRLPGYVAWDLGYKTLPGLLALVNDGVSQQTITSKYPRAYQEVQDLLPRLEAARLEFMKGIKREYDRMKSGGSVIRQLVLEAQAINREAMR